ncbi:hypothetical protein ACFOWX_07820 [Sphingorhabdus arenilitoris]|uniref:LapA family protein n=1 Tax=Sphingorhabdus arenilitoris TaxID=1490041 RepID=A0ABV8RGE5_9SPHN
MQFLKTLLWVILIVALVVFTINNWVPVSVKLWGGLLLDTKLPMLVIVSFIAGFVPLFIIYKTIIWRLKRKILTLETGTSRQPLRMDDPSMPPPAERSAA